MYCRVAHFCFSISLPFSPSRHIYTDVPIVCVLQAGITSAYQEKPCLDPTDPECPLSAPNKNLTQVSRRDRLIEIY